MEDLFPRLYRDNKNLQGDRIGDCSAERPANWAGSLGNAAFLLSPMLGLGLFIDAAASESPILLKATSQYPWLESLHQSVTGDLSGKQMFVHVFPGKLMQQKVRLMH